MLPVFLSTIFVPTETDGVGVTVGAEVIAGVGVAVGTGVAVGIGSLAIVSVLVTPQTVQVYVFMPSSAIVAGLVITPLFPGVLAGSRNFSYIFFAVYSVCSDGSCCRLFRRQQRYQ